MTLPENIGDRELQKFVETPGASVSIVAHFDIILVKD